MEEPLEDITDVISLPDRKRLGIKKGSLLKFRKDGVLTAFEVMKATDTLVLGKRVELVDPEEGMQRVSDIMARQDKQKTH